MAVQASWNFKQKSIISILYDAFCSLYVKQNNFNENLQMFHLCFFGGYYNLNTMTNNTNISQISFSLKTYILGVISLGQPSLENCFAGLEIT